MGGIIEMRVITELDNGRKWREVSHEARRSLCEDIVRRIGKHNWEYYYEAIDAFYKTTDPKIMGESIGTIAAMASVMPSEQKQRKALSDAILKGEITLQELEIFNYLQSRWDFYESRDTNYIPERHDSIVFSDGAQKFNLSEDDVRKVFNRIERIRYGRE